MASDTKNGADCELQVVKDCDSLPAEKTSNTSDANEEESKKNGSQSDAKKSRKKVYSVSLGNVNKKTKRDALFKHLHTVLLPEEIIQVFVRRDEGFIKLTTREAFDKALKLDKTELDGKKIRVRDPNNEKNESEEESDSDEPPSKKQKANEEEEEIIYEKVCSDSDDDVDDDDIEGDDSDDDEDDSDDSDDDDEDEAKKKNIELQKLLLKKAKKNKLNVKDERQLVKKHSVFIGNLYYSTTDNQVRTFIESIVAPEDIKRFFRPKCKDKPRGFAFVELATEEALERVLKLDGSKLMGRKVRIGRDDKQKKNDNDKSSGEKKLKGSNFMPKKKLKRKIK